MSARALGLGWAVAILAACGVRAWNALAGPVLYGYDAWGHLSYVFFLDLYRSVPYADQGWSFFHPPLYYGIGWLLAQTGSSEVLVRGLALVGGAASVAIAGLAAWVTRMALPERPGLALAAFTAVAFLPVQLYASTLPGNEWTAAALGSGTIALFVWNQTRDTPTLRIDLATGVLAGLALLTKFSAAIPLLALTAALAIQALRAGAGAAGRGQIARRAGAILIPALLLSGPFYLRNITEFGTPFRMSREDPMVALVERDQPPAERRLSDFVRVSPRLFTDSDPAAPHLRHSVWGSVFANAWSDNFGASQILIGTATRAPGSASTAAPAPGPHPPLTTLLLALGIGPTLLALSGALLSARQAWRNRGAGTDLLLLLLAAGSVAAFSVFAWEVRAWSALKASYLAGASLPYGFFVARSLGSLGGSRRRLLRYAGPVVLGVAAVVSTLTFTSGALTPHRPESHFMPGVRIFFGEVRSVYLPAGFRARLASQLGPRLATRAFVANRIAVAAALDGDPRAALGILDTALADTPRAELLNNRGAVRWLEGDRPGALRDLRGALALEPELAAARANLAALLEFAGSPEAPAARARAEQSRDLTPRGFPYGAGNGDMRNPNSFRWMLQIEPSRLELWLPPRSRAIP